MGSKYEMIKYGPDDVEAIRKEFNIDIEDTREEAFRIIEDWLLKQDHLVRKTFNRNYIENCIITSKGSVERAKLQIDKMCTMRTLQIKYFQVSDVNDSKLMETANKCYFGYSSRLTKERYRVFLIKIKPNISVTSSDFDNINRYFTLIGEFLKSVDFSKGTIFIADSLEANIAEILSKVNLFELQQFLPILTEGQGCKIKGIIFLTKSKFIEGFIKKIKPLFKEKIRNRIHVATNKDRLKEWISEDVLPTEYGGTEKALEQLHEDLFTTLSSNAVQELLREMNAARTDETKRQRDTFNDQYMGISGTFRTMTLD